MDTIKKEIDDDIDRMDDTSGEINPYCKIIVNKAERDNTILTEMEQWLILSNIVNHIQYDKHPKNIYNLDVRAVGQKNYKKINNKEEDRQIVKLNFSDT